MPSAKPSKLEIMYPPTGRRLECSTAAFEREFQPAGWVELETPKPAKAKAKS